MTRDSGYEIGASRGEPVASSKVAIAPLTQDPWPGFLRSGTMSICADMETAYLIRWSETPDEILIKFGQSSARIRSETLGLKNPRISARSPEMLEPMANMEVVPQVSLELQCARKCACFGDDQVFEFR